MIDFGMLGTVDLHKLIKSSNILAQERTLQRAKNRQVKQSTIVFLFSFITFFGELVEIENQAQKKAGGSNSLIYLYLEPSSRYE